MVTPVECAGVVSWFESVNWGVLGTWAGVAATMAGVVIALQALTTWKKQIRLQDRYQKADALLISYRKCLLAGFDLQWHAGFGEERKPLYECTESIQWRAWLDALMQ